MTKFQNIDKLNEAITVAEKVLEDIENVDNHKTNNKRKKINKALEHAYATLNLKDYSDQEIKNRTDEVWKSLVDNDPITLFFLFLVGFSLSGVMIFTVYQAYSLLETHLDRDPESHYPVLTEETSSKIKVDYIENNIISLYDEMSIDDSAGLQKDPQKFTISNDSNDIGKQNYLVKYAVYIQPLNDPKAKLLNKDHIKLKYNYVDEKGILHESKIMTLDDLSSSSDGSLLLMQGEQPRDSHHDFEVRFWISSLASNEEQGATYTMKFKIDGAIGKA